MMEPVYAAFPPQATVGDAIDALLDVALAEGREVAA